MHKDDADTELRYAMGIEAAIEYADQLLYERTGKHLSNLQSDIIQQSWKGKTYGQVATLAGYSEGHVKDVAAQLWKLLSEALGERITKGNLRSRLKNRIKRTIKSAPGSATVIAGIRGVQAQMDRAQADRQDAQLTQHTQAAYPADGFIGRQSDIQAIDSLTQSYRIIVIKGEGGLGKTTLAQQYAQRFDQVLELLMAKETENITPVESVVEEWLRQHFNEEPGREFGITLSRLKRHLQTRQVGILIDNLEPALDSRGQFINQHRHYVELLRVLGSTQATVLITSRDRLCEPGIRVHHYRLPGLSVEAWQQFFQAHAIDTSTNASDSLHTDILSKMHLAYGGNAKAMEILCAAIGEDFDGDLSAYWQENSTDLLGTADLHNLVSSQVNRLQQLDADAYRVFCRLGCYRYQEQSRLKASAITALMWDIDPIVQKQTLNSLRDRSLLEGRKGHYWLHPVSRAEAIARLRQTPDWPAANQAAAEYWTQEPKRITSVDDALKALEAYYHLIAIQDYDGAAAVLLNSRHNQWRQFLPLASSLYRLGLLQPAINAITQVLPKVNQGRRELNNILGDVYWITGNVHGAIACQQQTLSDTAPSSATARDRYYRKMLTVDAHLSIGLYHIDLWELSQAAEQFEQVIALAEGSAHQAWADKATVGLALVQAHLGNTETARKLASQAARQFSAGSDDEHGRYAYFLQLLGQAFGELGEWERAQQLHERAIASAEAGHYVQVKAKALMGLAMLKQQQGERAAAIALQKDAIALYEAIGATCDLAEAYFQLGCSLQQDRKTVQMATAYFEQAIAQFTHIKAPHQLERVAAARQTPCPQTPSRQAPSRQAPLRAHESNY